MNIKSIPNLYISSKIYTIEYVKSRSYSPHPSSTCKQTNFEIFYPELHSVVVSLADYVNCHQVELCSAHVTWFKGRQSVREQVFRGGRINSGHR